LENIRTFSLAVCSDNHKQAAHFRGLLHDILDGYLNKLQNELKRDETPGK